jgi:carboxymethylenebutenolidase
VYGFYGGNDARIGATIPATVAAMKAAGKSYDPVTYDGAGHGFMRAGEDPGNTVPGNKTAREQGFARLVKLLHEMKRAPTAGIGAASQTTTAKAGAQPVVCHGTSAAAATPSM